MKRLALLLPLALVACASVGAAPPTSVVRSTRVVRASWYDEGRFNADGSRFHPDDFTAAHRTLPFGTVVRVTHAGNGRSTLVTIRDRGPARWTGKDIDLSRGAARGIGMIDAGTATVRLEVLGK